MASSSSSSSSSSTMFTSVIIKSALSMMSMLTLLALYISKLAQNYEKPPKRGPLPPGPKMLLHKPTYQWIHSMMEKLNTSIACIRLGKTHVVTITCNEIAREVLHANDATFASRPVQMSTQLPTYGYLTVALTPLGQQWKKMRRVVTNEVLSAQRLRWLRQKRDQEADHLLGYVYNLSADPSTGGVVDVRKVSRHYCGNVIRRLMLNRRFFGPGNPDGGPGREETEHVDSLFTILAYINAFSVSDYFPWLRSYDLDGHQGILRKALAAVEKYNDPIIDERIEMWRNGTKQKAEDVLDVFIQLADSDGDQLLTRSELKAQILDLMLAAVDNPSHATEWALAEMLNQPAILERAVEELDTVVGRDRLVQESDLPKLNYVKACAREAFRLHPVSPFNVPHVSVSDTHIRGYFIPKGSHVLISRIGLGRNPEVWKQPLEFMPERHLNADGSEVVITDPKLGLLSFSTGRRGCPGVVLGSVMTTMLLARLLQGFDWSAPNGVSSINLTESQQDLTISEPLLAVASPRLPVDLYPTTEE